MKQHEMAVRQIGALLSDLTSHLFALVTEGETGELANQRERDIEASLKAISLQVARAATMKQQETADQAEPDTKESR